MKHHETKNPERLPASGVSKHSRKTEAEYTDISFCLEDFRVFINREYGLSLIGDLKADGHFYGIRTEDDRRGAKPFRYCVHLDTPQNVYFVDLKRGVFGLWFPKGQEPLSPTERDRLYRENEARRIQRDAEVRTYHANAAARAAAIWRRSTWANPMHPYLTRKGVGIHGIRALPVWERRIEAEGKPGQFETIRIPGVLLVPMRDETGALWNLQAIFPEVCPALERDKDFLPRAKKKGLFHWIGERTETVCLAEGYATGATIHEATGYRCIVCFDAGNLVTVAPIVRAMLPAARIVVCADHDLPDKRGRRAGLEYATEAADLVDGFIAVPPVPGADFNDWAAALKGGHHGG
jgi:putative DNA primase/helicase